MNWLARIRVYGAYALSRLALLVGGREIQQATPPVRPSRSAPVPGLPAEIVAQLPPGLHISPQVGCGCVNCGVARVAQPEFFFATMQAMLAVRSGEAAFMQMTKEIVTPDGAGGVTVLVIDAALYERLVKPAISHLGIDPAQADDPRA